MSAHPVRGPSKRLRGAASGKLCWPLEQFPALQAAGPASGLALDCWRKVKSASPPQIVISKVVWDRAMPSATSPALRLCAASAIAGYITGPRQFEDRAPGRQYEEFVANRHPAERVNILPGFP